MTETNEITLREEELDHASAALLVPAVQKVREAASRSQAQTADDSKSLSQLIGTA